MATENNEGADGRKSKWYGAKEERRHQVHEKFFHLGAVLQLSGLRRPPNDQVEQLAANTLTIPQDAIASLLQRLVRSFPTSGSETAPRSNLKEHLGATESDIKFQEEVGLTEDHWDAIALAPGKGKSDRRESLDLPKKDQTARF